MKLEAEGQTESDSHSFIKSLRYEHRVHVMQLSPVSSFALCVCSGIHNKRQTRTPRKEIHFLPIGGSVSPQSTCRKVSGATSLPSLQREPVHCVFTSPCFGANGAWPLLSGFSSSQIQSHWALGIQYAN